MPRYSSRYTRRHIGHTRYTSMDLLRDVEAKPLTRQQAQRLLNEKSETHATPASGKPGGYRPLERAVVDDEKTTTDSNKQ